MIESIVVCADSPGALRVGAVHAEESRGQRCQWEQG